MRQARQWLTRHWPLLVLPALILTGLLVAAYHPLDTGVALELGRQLFERPEILAAVVVVMALMFTLGLPGSLFVWLIAPFQPPLVATLLLVAGSVAGAIGGYAMAACMGRRWQPSPTARQILDLLSRRGDVMTQCALRALPGFPHSIVNYAGGFLRLPRSGFVTAAILGLTAKWGIYSSALHGVVEAVELGEAIRPATLWPLALLAALLLAGAAVRQILARRRRESDS